MQLGTNLMNTVHTATIRLKMRCFALLAHYPIPNKYYVIRVVTLQRPSYYVQNAR